MTESFEIDRRSGLAAFGDDEGSGIRAPWWWRTRRVDNPQTVLGGAPRLGATVAGKYRLDRVVGSGGVAVVFAATHRNQRQFALKMLHRELLTDTEIRSGFLREGHVANAIKHPGVVAVFDDDLTTDGVPFLVMELLDGAGVDRLCRARLPSRAVLALGHQLLDVLAAAHTRGVIHRDIKPANLFVTSDGTLKVLDFGIARIADARTPVAESGLFLGTPAFMAPEQALGIPSEIDGQTDLWSAGATLFTCLTGKLVNEGTTELQQMVHAATALPRPVAEEAPDVPPSVAEILDRALAVDKAARWPSAEAMRDAIATVYRALFGEPISREPLVGLVRTRGAALGPNQTRVMRSRHRAESASGADRRGPFARTRRSVTRITSGRAP